MPTINFDPRPRFNLRNSFEMLESIIYFFLNNFSTQARLVTGEEDRGSRLRFTGRPGRGQPQDGADRVRLPHGQGTGRGQQAGDPRRVKHIWTGLFIAWGRNFYE